MRLFVEILWPLVAKRTTPNKSHQFKTSITLRYNIKNIQRITNADSLVYRMEQKTVKITKTRKR